MSELARIADEIQRAYAGPAWHGPCVLEALEGVTPQTASKQPIAGAHSIWELVHHIGAWADIPRRRIMGEVFELTDEINFPPMPAATHAAWRNSLDGLKVSQQRLLDCVTSLTEGDLDRPSAKDGPSIYVVLHGVAQHHVYHAGQIVMLKKIV